MRGLEISVGACSVLLRLAEAFNTIVRIVQVRRDPDTSDRVPLSELHAVGDDKDLVVGGLI